MSLNLEERLEDILKTEISSSLYYVLLLSGKTQKSIKILPEAP